MANWLDQSLTKGALEAQFLRTWEKDILPAPGDEARYEKMLKRIHNATTSKKKSLRINEKWIRWAQMAASYLLLLLSSYFLFQLWSNDDSPKELERKVIFERTTGPGQKMRIQLPDQSSVFLNSLSTIRFDTGFPKTHRVIHLEGEAYFEVNPDKSLPFVVQAQEVKTIALGTAFNARSREGKVTISLTEGKVSVSYDQTGVTLNPGQMAVLDPLRENSLKQGTFDPVSVTAWKEGEISFKSKALGEILEDLEDWYGVDFSIKDNVDLTRRVTGLFNNSNLKDIMTGLSFSLDLEYSINGNQVTVQPQRPMK